ncbi:hypothetical protein Hanom_Chr14g01259561 [Helianthus anomalus]
MKNMPLLKIEQDFYQIFKWWHYDSEIGEAVIVVHNDDSWKITEELTEAVIAHKRIYGLWRCIRALDSVWLVSFSKKDIECLFYSKISYEEKDKEQALQFQKVINVCYANDINSGKVWKTEWRKLEDKEELKKEQNEAILTEKVRQASLRRFQFGNTYNRPPPTDQMPIASEEHRGPRKHFFGR